MQKDYSSPERTQLAPEGRKFRQEDGGAGLTSDIPTAPLGGSGSSVPGSREAGVPRPELEVKGPLQSQPQRPHFPPNCEQAASC